MQTSEQATVGVERLTTLDIEHLLHPLANLHDRQRSEPLIVDRGEGIYLNDAKGKRYIDAAAGMWNVNIGHGRAELAEVAAQQMSRLEYASSFGGFTNQPSIELGHKVAQLTPGDLNTILLTSGGSESNDSAFKLARLYWKQRGKPTKTTIIGRYGGYHGLTLATTQATGIPRYWHMVDPGVTGFHHINPPYRYRCTHCSSARACTHGCTDELARAIEYLGPDNVAAFIAEPIIGTGGVIVPPDDYFPRVREICDQYDVLFIADEVITGFGRTGKWFGVDNWNVVPDIMTVAKGISSGYLPLGGVVISDRVREPLYADPKLTLMHGFTYTGHPVCCAVAVRNIEIMEREGLIEQAARVGAYLLARLREIGDRYECIGEVRGVGLMAGIEFVLDRSSRTEASPADRLAVKVSQQALDRGLLCRPMPGSDVLAFSPPLITQAEDVDRLSDILDESIAAVCG